MRLAISNIAWDTEYDNAIYRHMRSRGFTGLEIAPTRLCRTKTPYAAWESEQVLCIVKNIKKNYGLEPCSMQSILYGVTDNIFQGKEQRLRLIDHLGKACAYAALTGFRNLVFGCPANRNMADPEHDYATGISFFRQLALVAATHGVIIAVEPVSPEYGTNFLNTMEQTVKFVLEVDKSAVRINLDLGALITGGESLAQARPYLGLVNHIHISEPGLARIRRRLLHVELAEMLVQENYDRWISIEMKSCESISQVMETIDYIADVFSLAFSS
ncbi:MAG: sugar phosphate isomerase/epimerase [Desulfovibrionaceae bacterium]|nr:sugar phosphate isomerase/epimerase [Desulfovibrionaceae bacterium]